MAAPNAPALFWCAFSSDEGTKSTGPVPALFDDVKDSSGAMVTVQGVVYCPVPEFPDLKFLLPTESGPLNVSLSYFKPPGDKRAVDIRFGGVDGGQTVEFGGLVAPPPPTPPMPPPSIPPSPAPPPALPLGDLVFTFDDASYPHKNYGTAPCKGGNKNACFTQLGQARRTTQASSVKAGAGSLDLCGAGSCGAGPKFYCESHRLESDQLHRTHRTHRTHDCQQG